jgi:hypothetical protein
MYNKILLSACLMSQILMSSDHVGDSNAAPDSAAAQHSAPLIAILSASFVPGSTSAADLGLRSQREQELLGLIAASKAREQEFFRIIIETYLKEEELKRNIIEMEEIMARGSVK